MFEIDGTLLLRVLPVMTMLAMVWINLSVTQGRFNRRFGEETGRLKAALSIEFVELSRLYQENVKLLDEGAGYLLPTRQFVAVYRANLGRITQFEPEVAAAMIEAFCYNETLEAFVAAHTRLHGGYVFKFEPVLAAHDDIRQRYLGAQDKIAKAMIALRDNSAGIPEGQRQKASEIKGLPELHIQGTSLQDASYR
jgi:hypothetical protein